MSEAVDVVLVLADISGYTGFMLKHRKALRHAQMIVAELLDTLVEQAVDPLEVSKLEGDAVFMHAPVPGDDAGRLAIGERIESMFIAFSAALGHLQRETICRCAACRQIGDLRLKVFVHAGEVVFMPVGTWIELQGIAPIEIHRLTKNSVEDDEYLLVTEAALPHLEAPDALDFVPHVEVYPDIGVLSSFVAASPTLRQTLQCEIRPMLPSALPWDILRAEIQEEYSAVATAPERDFHFNLGETEARLCEYDEDDIAQAPPDSLASFAGTGNPFKLGPIGEGAKVVDVGCGAGFDVANASRRVGPTGRVIGVDMTHEMVQRARRALTDARYANVEIREGFAEQIPVEDGWADVVISNGVFNLCPDKTKVLNEVWRVLRPGGRLQFGDIVVGRKVPDAAKRNIDLWTG